MDVTHQSSSLVIALFRQEEQRSDSVMFNQKLSMQHDDSKVSLKIALDNNGQQKLLTGKLPDIERRASSYITGDQIEMKKNTSNQTIKSPSNARK